MAYSGGVGPEISPAVAPEPGTRILLRRSGVQGKLPSAGDAEYGELFVNYHSGNPMLCFKDNANNIVELRPVRAIDGGGGETPPDTGNDTGAILWDGNYLLVWDGTDWEKVGPSDLAYVQKVDGGTITNTAGDDVDLPLATVTYAGLIVDAPSNSKQYARVDGSWVEVDIPPSTTVSAFAPSGPVTGQLWYDTNTGQLKVFDSTLWQVSTVDLGYVAAADKGTVTCSVGANAELPLVSSIEAGLMGPTDKGKLDGYPATPDDLALDLQDVTDNGSTTTNGATFGGDVSINSVWVGRGGGDSDTNLRVGPNALANNTTGENNIAIGRDALAANTTGNLNAAIGRYALASNTEGYGNVAFGRETMRYNVDGNINAAFGSNALTFNTSGSFNSALGNDALNKNTTGDLNVGLGRLALVDSETGSRNIGVGANAGQGIVTGSNNTIIGGITGTAALSNTIVIGAGIKERIRVDSTGSFLFGGTLPGSPTIELNNDGSATFATGDISLKTDGSVNLTTAGDAITINGSSTAGVDTQIRFTMSGNVGEVGSTGTGINNGQGNIWLATKDGSNIEKALYINGTRDVLIGGVLPASPKISLNANGNSSFDGKITLTGESPAGIQFGSTNSGDTIHSKTLNDYEEGIFTPTVEEGITSPIYDTGATFGRYRTIGKQFFFSLRVSLNGGTAEDIQLKLGGLPVVPAGGAVYLYPQIGIFQRGANKTGVIAVPRASNTILDIQNMNDGSPITGTEATNTLILVVNGAYPI